MMDDMKLRQLLAESDEEHERERIAIQLSSLRKPRIYPVFIEWRERYIKRKLVTER